MIRILFFILAFTCVDKSTAMNLSVESKFNSDNDVQRTLGEVLCNDADYKHLLAIELSLSEARSFELSSDDVKFLNDFDHKKVNIKSQLASEATEYIKRQVKLKKEITFINICKRMTDLESSMSTEQRESVDDLLLQ